MKEMISMNYGTAEAAEIHGDEIQGKIHNSKDGHSRKDSQGKIHNSKDGHSFLPNRFQKVFQEFLTIFWKLFLKLRLRDKSNCIITSNKLSLLKHIKKHNSRTMNLYSVIN